MKTSGLDVAPHLREAEGDDHCATTLYSPCNRLHRRPALECFVQVDKAQRRICVRVVPGCLCNFNNGLLRKYRTWIEGPS